MWTTKNHIPADLKLGNKKFKCKEIYYRVKSKWNASRNLPAGWKISHILKDGQIIIEEEKDKRAKLFNNPHLFLYRF